MRGLAVLVVVVAALMFCGASAVSVPPTFTLDLTVSPMDRWTGAVETIVATYGWEYSLGPTLQHWNQTLFKYLPSSVFSDLEKHLKTHLPDIYWELQGIATGFANIGHPEIDSKVLAGWVYFYELAHVNSFSVPKQYRFCTGLLALPEDPNEPIVHGRNLDLLPLELRNVTMIINVTSNGTTQHQGIGFLWFATSYLTSSRVGGLTMNGDWRNEEGNFTLAEILARIHAPKQRPLIRFFRDVQEKMMSFDEFIPYVMDLDTPAAFYMIVSAFGRRGAVLTCGWDKKKNRVEYLNDTTAESGKWFIAQMNSDRWLPPPANDPRQIVAERTMNSLGRRNGATPLGVWMTISEFPVHNGGTAYSTIMKFDKPLLGYTRLAMNPVRPWYPPHP